MGLTGVAGPARFRPVAITLDPSVAVSAAAPPMTIRTPAPPWAYAVWFVRDPAPAIDAPFGVRVTLAVAEGRIGVGCLSPDERTFLDESFVDAGVAPVTVELLADRPVLTGPLVIRNAASRGPSVATLLAVETFSLPDEPSLDRWPVPLAQPRAVVDWPRYYGPHGRNLAEKQRARRFARLEAPLTVSWSDGLRFRVVPGDPVSQALYASGTYEPQTLRVLRPLVAPGDVFVDLGANAGVVSLVAARWVGPQGRVLAVEPSAREFARLVDHAALNALDQLTPVRAAVVGTSGPRTLRLADPSRAGLNTLGDAFAYEGIETAGYEPVEGLSLDDLVAGAGLDRVHVVKLDVEGSEAEALDGAATVLRTHRPILVVEVCATSLGASGASVAGLEARLRDAGYACFEIDDATGALRAVTALSDEGDRNVVALPAERAQALAARIGIAAAA
jgi:FkbM family methyltransferase